MQPLLKESINLYGEAVQRLNASGPLPHTNDQALDGMKQRLLSWGIPVEGFQLVDGSGLSRRDVISRGSAAHGSGPDVRPCWHFTVDDERFRWPGWTARWRRG